LVRKYRILDDCARLREVIAAFPEDRHFIPSILFILWGEDESETLPDDLRSMVRSPVKPYSLTTSAHTSKQAGDYETKGIVGSHATFCLSSKTKDLDEKFTQVLNSMDLDITGGLVEILSRQGRLHQFCVDEPADFYHIIRVFATRHRTLEGLCLGLGGEMLRRRRR
jgi:nuclear mRNA export protein SAC3